MPADEIEAPIEEKSEIDAKVAPVADPIPSRFSPKLIFIFFVVITGALALVTGFLLSQNQKLKEANPTQPTSTSSEQPALPGQTQNPSDVPYGDENIDTDPNYKKAMDEYQDQGPNGWKDFTTKDGKYSLKYPPDWTLTDNSKEVDSYGDGNPQLAHEITITNGQYSFNSYNPLAMGPNICLYPDSPPYQGPGGDNMISEYVEVKGLNATYRRPQTSTYSTPTGLRWFVCQKSDDGSFASVAGFGDTWYNTPAGTPDPTLLLMMDQILANFKANK